MATDVVLTQCYLLKLPAEIRNRVVRLAVVEDNSIALFNSRFAPWRTYCHWKQVQEPFAEPALLSVCKQIRNEALPVFYGCNIFSDTLYRETAENMVKTPKLWSPWVSRLTLEKQAMLKTIWIYDCTVLRYKPTDRMVIARRWARENAKGLSLRALHVEVYGEVEESKKGNRKRVAVPRCWTNQPEERHNKLSLSYCSKE